MKKTPTQKRAARKPQATAQTGFSSAQAAGTARVALRQPRTDGTVAVTQHLIGHESPDVAHRMISEYQSDAWRVQDEKVAPNEEAAVEFWKQSQVRVTGYDGFPSDGPLSEDDKDRFCADPVLRRHAIIAANLAINALSPQAAVTLLPFDTSSGS